MEGKTISELLFTKLPKQEGKFVLECKLTGNGAVGLDARWIGDKGSIENCLKDMMLAGYIASDCVVYRYER